MNKTKEEILDSIVRDWNTEVTRPDCYEAMKEHAIEFGTWLNNNCDIWGNHFIYAQGDGKDYDAVDIYNKFLQYQNK